MVKPHMRIGIMSASTEGEELRENKRLIEEIEAQNHDPVLINYRQDAVSINPEGRFLYQYDKQDNLIPIEVDAVIPRIGKYVDSGTLVLSLLTSKNVYSTVSPEAVRIAKNKMLAHIALDNAGIPTPFSIAPTGVRPHKHPRSTLRHIQPDTDGKVIIKTLIGSHGEGVMLAEGEHHSVPHVQTLRANNIRYLVQEFAEAPKPEDLASDVRVIVLEGTVVAAMQRRAQNKREFRSNLAQQGKGLVYEPTDREAELAVRACEMLNIPVGGVDIIPSHRGPLVNEVNVSPEFGIEQVTGVNVAKAIVDLVVRNVEARTPDVQTLSEN